MCSCNIGSRVFQWKGAYVHVTLSIVCGSMEVRMCSCNIVSRVFQWKGACVRVTLSIVCFNGRAHVFVWPWQSCVSKEGRMCSCGLGSRVFPWKGACIRVALAGLLRKWPRLHKIMTFGTKSLSEFLS